MQMVKPCTKLQMAAQKQVFEIRRSQEARQLPLAQFSAATLQEAFHAARHGRV